MVRLVTERKTVSEDPDYSPARQWIKWVAGGAVLVMVYVAATRISATDSSHSYTITSTEAACSTEFIGTLAAIGGHTISVEASVGCGKTPAAMKFTVQLQYRAKPGVPWSNVGKPGGFSSPPNKLTQANYVYTNAPCRAGDFRAVYTLSGTGKVSGVAFSYPPTTSTVRTIKDGECQ